jgi:hypothetical protein
LREHLFWVGRNPGFFAERIHEKSSTSPSPNDFISPALRSP